MFNPFAPNRTRGRFAFSWDVVVHTATWLNAICATGPQPPPRCLSNLCILPSYIPTHSSVSRDFIDLPRRCLPSPYIGAAGGLFACGLSECVASVEHALRLFKMLLETSRKFFVSGCLCHFGGRMSGSACNRRPWLERLLGRAPVRAAWHNDEWAKRGVRVAVTF